MNPPATDGVFDLALVRGDARRIPLADATVQCVVTSPPYWGLRKYSGAQDLVWENSASVFCGDHAWAEETRPGISGGLRGVKADYEPHRFVPASSSGTCVRCGAWRGAYGLEPTVEMYVDHTVEILREIRRVLRPDGVVFWNIGDSYASTGGHSDTACNERRGAYNLGNRPEHDHREFRQSAGAALKPKDLCLIPARVALAAQADGWWVRSLIIWAKPNPMPESVTDRPTDAYEHILMLTKSERYFWDAEAVREPKAESTLTDLRSNDDGARRERGYPGAPSNGGTNLGGPDGGRNMRNVWTFPTQPYSGAHFATFPEEIPRRCILAATSSGGACVTCGAPWRRLTEPSPEYAEKLGRSLGNSGDDVDTEGKATGFGEPRISAEYVTIGWERTCDCSTEETRPCLVLDPFGGSGTTGRVAVELNRRAVLLDLAYSADAYAPLARERTTNVQRGMFL